MSSSGCSYFEPGVPGETVAPGGDNAGIGDTGPQPNDRGHYQNFLPPQTATELAALAESGAGLDAIGHADCGCGSGPGGLLWFGLGLFAAVIISRPAR